MVTLLEWKGQDVTVYLFYQSSENISSWIWVCWTSIQCEVTTPESENRISRNFYLAVLKQGPWNLTLQPVKWNPGYSITATVKVWIANVNRLMWIAKSLLPLVREQEIAYDDLKFIKTPPNVSPPTGSRKLSMFEVSSNIAKYVQVKCPTLKVFTVIPSLSSLATFSGSAVARKHPSGSHGGWQLSWRANRGRK